MAKNNCSICNRGIEKDDAPILVMGPYGNPRLLCDECAGEIETAVSSRDYDEIADAVEKIGKKMSTTEPDDLTITTVNELLSSSAERARAIKDGTYDFSLDEQDDEELEDIPEDMKESEDDAALDAAEETRNKKIDKVFNWISAILFSAIGAYALYTILRLFLF